VDDDANEAWQWVTGEAFSYIGCASGLANNIPFDGKWDDDLGPWASDAGWNDGRLNGASQSPGPRQPKRATLARAT
jgi:hypothetical protein